VKIFRIAGIKSLFPFRNCKLTGPATILPIFMQPETVFRSREQALDDAAMAIAAPVDQLPDLCTDRGVGPGEVAGGTGAGLFTFGASGSLLAFPRGVQAMNREREIQIIAEEICSQVPGAILSRTDGSLYLEPADCRTIAMRIVNRLESHRRGRGAPL